MKKILVIIAFSTLYLTSCESKIETEETTKLACNVTSIQQLPWFQPLVYGKGSCTLYDAAKLYQYEFNESQVFYLSNPASSVGICNRVLYNCSGEILSGNWTDSDWGNFETRSQYKKLLWSK